MTIDPENWHPENWDAVTLAWLHTADGAEALALLKAAPDLLAACKLAKEHLDKMGLDWLGKGPDPLEAAIAKAEGRT